MHFVLVLNGSRQCSPIDLTNNSVAIGFPIGFSLGVPLVGANDLYILGKGGIV